MFVHIELGLFAAENFERDQSRGARHVVSLTRTARQPLRGRRASSHRRFLSDTD
jgi:hypothetical protein